MTKGLVKRAFPALYFLAKMKSIIAIKTEMQTKFTPDGKAWATTGLLAGPCVVTGLRTKEKDGYDAVQLGLGEKKKKINKPTLGFVKKAGLKACPRIIREVEADQSSPAVIGQEIKIEEVFNEGDKVRVSGISKGKGFAGVVKRWHFKGGPRTHGQSDRERAPGSSGQTTTPGRVIKGKRRAGRMGNEKVTVKNLEVLKIEPEKSLLWVKGAVPGRKGNVLIINKIS